jgi:pyruvate kinase
MQRRARIIATIGPASASPEVVERLLAAGMSVARLNFSHGTHEEHDSWMALLRAAADRLHAPLALLLDLQGPKVRVGELGSPIELASGETVWLHKESGQKRSTELQSIPVDFPQLFEAVQPGDTLLLDEGKLRLTALGSADGGIQARVDHGGTLSAHKGINLPGVHLPIPAFTEKDRADLEFGLAHGVDAVAMSFVRSAEDVKLAKAALDGAIPAGQPSPILIAKLEKPEALGELEAILDLVDGVMVARGDLGVELPPESVPPLQKKIIRAANARGRLVITATQMLESMVHNPLPTRAEASDVANAVFDGTDAVMLSGETAVGEYPVESVSTMDRIVREAEAHLEEWGHGGAHGLSAMGDAGSVALAAGELARDRDVAAIAVFTVAGTSAWAVSQARPDVPILAFTPEPRTYRRLALLWGVHPCLVPFAASLEEMLAILEDAAERERLLQPGQQVVVVCSFPVGEVRSPNMALLHTLGARS